MTLFSRPHHIPTKTQNRVLVRKSLSSTAVAAMESRLYRRLASRLVECEERTRLLRRMIVKGVGFKEEEDFIVHEMSKLKGQNQNFWKDRREILTLLMSRKLRDNLYFEKTLRMRRDSARKEMSDLMGQNSTACRRVVRKSKEEGMRVRMRCRLKNEKKMKYLCEKYDVKKSGEDLLCEEDMMRYGKAKVFTGEDIKPVQMRDPVIVCKKDEMIELK